MLLFGQFLDKKKIITNKVLLKLVRTKLTLNLHLKLINKK